MVWILFSTGFFPQGVDIVEKGGNDRQGGRLGTLAADVGGGGAGCRNP